VTGTVESIHLLSVLIRTTSGVFVWLPVANLFDSGLSNYHANAARRYEYDVGIRYQDDLQEAIRIIAGILSTYTFVLKYPAPEVFVSTLGADSVIIRVRIWFPSVWANTKDDISLQTEVLSRVKAGLESEGIEIAYAQRVIWFANQPASEHNHGTR
jgi:small-conductance mechanosensitive channel